MELQRITAILESSMASVTIGGKQATWQNTVGLRGSLLKVTVTSISKESEDDWDAETLFAMEGKDLVLMATASEQIDYKTE